MSLGATSTYGGPCQTPTFTKLAEAGLKYNHFHTTALCSPTRAALITGRNHHSGLEGNLAGDRRPRGADCQRENIFEVPVVNAHIELDLPPVHLAMKASRCR